MRTSRKKLTRRFATQIKHRGRTRPVVVEIDREAGTISLRLHGCRTRKTYQATDLFQWGPQLSMPI